MELVPEWGPWGNAGRELWGSAPACLETGLGAERAPLCRGPRSDGENGGHWGWEAL